MNTTGTLPNGTSTQHLEESEATASSPLPPSKAGAAHPLAAATATPPTKPGPATAGSAVASTAASTATVAAAQRADASASSSAQQEEGMEAVELVPDEEPTVECTAWCTSALPIAAGGAVEVPLIVGEPSVCSYEFSSDTQIEFMLSLADPAEPPAVALYEAHGKGSCEVRRAGYLFARLGNTASLVTTATVACHVSVRPLGQLLRAEKHRQAMALQAALRTAEEELRLQFEQQAARRLEEKTLRETMSEMQEQLESVLSDMAVAERRQKFLREEIASLQVQVASARRLAGGHPAEAQAGTVGSDPTTEATAASAADARHQDENGEAAEQPASEGEPAPAGIELDEDEGDDGGAFTEEDAEAVARLEQLGFSHAAALEAYFFCRKNENVAANFLVDRHS